MARWPFDLLALGAGAYGVVVASAYVLQRRMLFRPDGLPDTPARSGVPEMAPVPVRSRDGLELRGWYAAPSSPDRLCVVYFHGNNGHIGRRADRVRPLLDAGLGVWLAGYRGYGGNPGQPTEAGLYDDARAVLAALAERGIDSRRVIAYGESLGTGIAVQMALEHRLAAVILEAPYTRIPDVGPAYIPKPLARLLATDPFDSESKIARLHAPLLIVHGTGDRRVPVSCGKRLFAAAAQPKQAVFIEGAGHADLYAHGAGPIVLDFIAQIERAARPETVPA